MCLVCTLSPLLIGGLSSSRYWYFFRVKIEQKLVFELLSYTVYVHQPRCEPLNPVWVLPHRVWNSLGVAWGREQSAKRMVQSMSKGLYSMSTVVQGERLGQFLDTEMPSMSDLKVLRIGQVFLGVEYFECV